MRNDDGDDDYSCYFVKLIFFFFNLIHQLFYS